MNICFIFWKIETTYSIDQKRWQQYCTQIKCFTIKKNYHHNTMMLNNCTYRCNTTTFFGLLMLLRRFWIVSIEWMLKLGRSQSNYSPFDDGFAVGVAPLLSISLYTKPCVAKAMHFLIIWDFLWMIFCLIHRPDSIILSSHSPITFYVLSYSTFIRVKVQCLIWMQCNEIGISSFHFWCNNSMSYSCTTVYDCFSYLSKKRKQQNQTCIDAHTQRLWNKTV